MSRRTATWLAWSVLAVCVVLITLALLLHLLTGFVPFAEGRPGFGFALLAGVLSLAYPTVGALIASRLPSNPIGWFFCSLGLLYAAHRVIVFYADYALNENFALPGGERNQITNPALMSPRYATPTTEAEKAIHLICWRTSPPERL